MTTRQILRVATICSVGIVLLTGDRGAMPLAAQTRTAAPAKPQPAKAATKLFVN